MQFYISSLWGKNISPNLTNSKGPKPNFFGPLEPEPLEKNESRSRKKISRNLYEIGQAVIKYTLKCITSKIIIFFRILYLFLFLE